MPSFSAVSAPTLWNCSSSEEQKEFFIIVRARELSSFSAAQSSACSPFSSLSNYFSSFILLLQVGASFMTHLKKTLTRMSRNIDACEHPAQAYCLNFIRSRRLWTSSFSYFRY